MLLSRLQKRIGKRETLAYLKGLILSRKTHLKLKSDILRMTQSCQKADLAWLLNMHESNTKGKVCQGIK